MEIKEKKMVCHISTLINTGNYENVNVCFEKEVVYTNATKEEEDQLHKAMAQECADRLIKQGNFFLKRLDRKPEKYFPASKKSEETEEDNYGQSL
jgi:hypothetical protein